MLGREHLVSRLQRGAEIGDQRIDVEEWRAAVALWTLAASNGGDMGASALAEDVVGGGADRRLAGARPGLV